VIALALTGGRSWWRNVDAGYSRRIFVPYRSALALDTAGAAVLRLTLDAADWQARAATPLVADHGKLVHLFLAGEEGAASFAHLHPLRVDSLVFETPRPPLPAGTYRYFADIVQENGFAQTLTGTVSLPATSGVSPPPADRDDAIALAPAERSVVTAPAPGLRVEWERPAELVAGGPTVLRFRVLDAAGAPAVLEPYLGMPAHAMIAREDGGVFVHLHGMGSVSAASLAVLNAIERGDTLASRRPNAPRPRLAAPAMDHLAPLAPAAVEFPFAFPSPGPYRLWLQFRHAGAVRTAAFGFEVRPPTR
jgi:hypothetical protein